MLRNTTASFSAQREAMKKGVSVVQRCVKVSKRGCDHSFRVASLIKRPCAWPLKLCKVVGIALGVGGSEHGLSHDISN